MKFPLFRFLSGLLFATALSTAFSSAARAGTTTLDITVDTDGRDDLIIHGNTLQWEHFDYTPVGLVAAADKDTNLTTTTNGVTDLYSVGWLPTWPDGTASGDLSSVFTSLAPAAPTGPAAVTLTVESARDSLTLAQAPTAANDYTTILDFNDDPAPGYVPYEAKLTYVTANPVDLPPAAASGAFTMAGIAGAALIRRRVAKAA
jgi:hypothetical protein